MKQKYKDKGEISYRISHKGDTHVIVHARIVNDFVIVRTFSFVLRISRRMFKDAHATRDIIGNFP